MWLYHATGKPVMLQNCVYQLGTPLYLDAFAFAESFAAGLQPREAYPLPDIWEKQRGGKKIILLDIHIESFATWIQQIKAKLESIFAAVRQQPGILLWWRPDRRIPSALGALNPEIWQGYQQLCQQYQAEMWGIYDDSADIGRAVAWADAVYGDAEQLLGLCSRMGKPAMRMNIGLV